MTHLREGPPDWTHENLRIWQHVGRSAGSEAITLRIIEVGLGRSPWIMASECEEVLFVLAGRGTVHVDGHSIELRENAAVHVAPERALAVENLGPEPLVLVSSQCPDPREPPRFVAAPLAPDGPRGPGPKVVQLEEQPSEETGDRWYRVMIHSAVTQFVGAIPPGRAPDHFHHYEEVIFILTGRGRMWAGATTTPIQAGSCIFLPKRQMHCLENTGDGEMRLLGVFYPSGSPAVRYE